MMFSARFEHSNPFIEATTLFFGVHFFFVPEMSRALPNRSSHLAYWLHRHHEPSMAHQDSRKIPKISKIYYCFSKANIGPIVSRFEFRNAHRLYHVFFNVFHEKYHFWIFDFDHDFSFFFSKKQRNSNISTKIRGYGWKKSWKIMLKIKYAIFDY